MVMIDLELEILSMALLNHSVFPSVIEHADLFIRWKHLYDIMFSMYDENVNFSLPSIYSRIEEKHGHDRAVSDCSKLTSCHGLSMNLHDYINQLARLRRREYVRDVAKTIISNRDMTLEEIENLITDASDKMAATAPDDGEMITDYASKPLDEIFKPGDGCQTGIPELDQKLHSVKPGQFMIIAARPSKGKTALMLQIVEHMAKFAPGDGVILVFSMDGTKDELYSRLLSRRARVESWKIEHNKLTDDERRRIIAAHDYYKNSGLKIKIYDTVSDLYQIKAKIKKHKNIKAVVADYLQQMEGDKSGNREQEISSIAGSFKRMAMGMKLPFILLSQLSRANEKQNREPILSDLRESGAIEQDANIVLFIHSSDEEKQKDVENSNFLLAKNKNGPTGKIKTNFNKPYFQFGIILDDDSVDWTHN